MLAKATSYGLIGIDAYGIEIEADVSNGLPSTTIVGLADGAVRESKDRVKAAIKNSGFRWPEGRITVNLAPSDIKKEGSSYDLPIALGILAATEQLNRELLKNYSIVGELALDGTLRCVCGALPISLQAGRSPYPNLILPADNAQEAALSTATQVFGLKTLRNAVEFLHNPGFIQPVILDAPGLLKQKTGYEIDFAEVKGQYFAKRALEVAVSGGHNVLMIGPPGSGKTMLAKRIPTIMPDITLEEALEVTKIHSSTGALIRNEGIIGRRPFRCPHHSISSIAMIGGGSIPKPGELSLAHAGVLFLDELPEFRRDCLETLRQPLEDGTIRVSRVQKTLTFPADAMLVAAMNPCPCGYFTDPRKTCKCNSSRISAYTGKISGPLLDRIDIHIELPAIRYSELTESKTAESSQEIKQRVERSRLTQTDRFKNDGILHNGRMTTRLIRKYCVMTEEAKELLRMAMTELGLSARAYDKVLRVSRTIADLAGTCQIKPEHVAEAVQYRSLDRKY